VRAQAMPAMPAPITAIRRWVGVPAEAVRDFFVMSLYFLWVDEKS
jgi:hypothetical protein